jgi:hypothetical protein
MSICSPSGGPPALFIYSGGLRFPSFSISEPGKAQFFGLTRMPTRLLCPSGITSRSGRPDPALEIIQNMQDRTVMKKMVGSALAGLLFFITAMFTTMLDLTIPWRNIWLGFCLVFFLLALSGVFILCGDLNSEHSEPDEAKPKE